MALILQFEGFSPTAYRCPAGWWTIGYGHVLRLGEAPMVLDEAAAPADLAPSVRVVRTPGDRGLVLGLRVRLGLAGQLGADLLVQSHERILDGLELREPHQTRLLGHDACAARAQPRRRPSARS